MESRLETSEKELMAAANSKGSLYSAGVAFESAIVEDFWLLNLVED